MTRCNSHSLGKLGGEQCAKAHGHDGVHTWDYGNAFRGAIDVLRARGGKAGA